MRTFKATPELVAKLEKRKRIINIVVATFIAGSAFHAYSVVEHSKRKKIQRELSEQRYALLVEKFNDKLWVDGLQSKLGSLKDTRHFINSVHFSEEEIKEMEANGFDKKLVELRNSTGSII